MGNLWLSGWGIYSLNGWGRYGVNGWTSYGTVSCCFFLEINAGLQESTFSSHHMVSVPLN